MPTKTTEDVKKHGDTLEPLIERTGGSTQRKPANKDDVGREEANKDVLNDDA